MKKNVFKVAVLSAALAFSADIFCDEIKEPFSELMLANGMSVFVYEDFSTPLVHAKFCAKAGYESRNESDAPFLLLCAELFADAGSGTEIENRGFAFPFQSECTANGTRLSFDCTGAELKDAFSRIAERAFAPLFSDETLQTKFEKIKSQEPSTAERFINAHINSRVFGTVSRHGAPTPYPPFSEQTNLSKLRAIVSMIFQERYAPQNCALFVSGAISAQSVLRLAQETFGIYAGRPQATGECFFLAKQNSESETSGHSDAEFAHAGKKLILSDAAFSSDFAQVALQISPLEKNKAKIAAAIFEANDSALKTSLVQNAALAIRGSDYVNAAAATKRNLSRVVIQTLLEKSERSAFEQAEILERIVGEELCGFSEAEFDAAKKNLCQDFYDSISNPKSFMEQFARFWTDEISEEQNGGGTFAERFRSIPEKIAAEDFSELKSALQKSDVWMFVMLNEGVLSPLQTAFERSGYEIIAEKNQRATEKNAEDIAHGTTDADVSGSENASQKEIPIYDAEFVAQSRAQEKTFFLSNKIRVTLKEHPSSKKTAVALYVFGGEAFDAESNYGMQSVLADIVERNVSETLAQNCSHGTISRRAKTATSVSDTEFFITVECDSDEAKSALRCIGEGLLLNDFVPSRLDLAVNARRSQQILRAGNPARQLYSAGVRQFYKSATYRSLYPSRKEILESSTYNDALEAYQGLLDAGRIEIIAAGNFCGISEAEFVGECERIFGSLKSSRFKKQFSSEPNKVSKPALAVKLEHTFLTDISADKAGPRPAILVPTTDFHDPVQFWIRSPKQFEEDAAIFDALILELEAHCKKVASQHFQGIESHVEERSALVSFGAITLFNVNKISDAEFIFKKATEQLREKLFADASRASNGGNATEHISDFSDSSEEAFFNGMKARWIRTRYGESFENAGAVARLAREASLMRLSGGQSKSGATFAREYETVARCGKEKFRQLWQRYFEGQPFKLYSTDSKK